MLIPSSAATRTNIFISALTTTGRSWGAYYAYTAFCETAGFEAVPLEQFQTGRYDTFLGSMYGFTEGYPQSEVLKQHPDYLELSCPSPTPMRGITQTGISKRHAGERRVYGAGRFRFE